MHAINAQTNWHSHTEIKHWIKHALIPLTLIVVFLYLPKPWTLALFQPNSVIEIELIETQQLLPVTPTPEPTLIKPQLAEPGIEQPAVTPITDPIKFTAKEPDKNITKSMPQETISVTKTPEINAGNVLQMIQNRTSVNITPEFQARTGPAKDFYIPEHEIHDWLADIPFMDESVDKPKLQMKFYAQGFTGGIEKFFDKITISKTFTTKYGTKIHCALIGVIAACGWK